MYLYKLYVLSFLHFVNSKIFFEENFDDPGWDKRWHRTGRQEFNGKSFGHFNWTAGRSHYDENDRGIRTMDDNSYYAISQKFPAAFTNRNRTLVVQFSVKFERRADLRDAYDQVYCAAAFVKLLPSSHNPLLYDSDSKYLYKFGPDACPTAQKIESTILYRGKHWPFVRRMDFDRKIYIYMPGPFFLEDPHTHLYTFIIHPNNTFEKRVDGKVIAEESGHFEQCWQTHPEPRIQVVKYEERPDDWDERDFIVDPTETKPLDWDQPEEIVDPFAAQPDDWDAEADGPWQHPVIRNPAYKGEWQPTKLIPNPNNKGPWTRAMKDNPLYVPDPDMYLMKDIAGIGIEGWNEHAGTIIDNILVTDDVELAMARGVPVQQKAIEVETRWFEERCEKERLARVAEMKRIDAEKKKLKKIFKAQKLHDEL